MNSCADEGSNMRRRPILRALLSRLVCADLSSDVCPSRITNGSANSYPNVSINVDADVSTNVHTDWCSEPGTYEHSNVRTHRHTNLVANIQSYERAERQPDWNSDISVYVGADKRAEPWQSNVSADFETDK